MVCAILLERADDRKQKRKEDYSMDGRIQKIFQILWLLSLPLLIYLSVGDLVFTAWSTVRGRILQEEILPLSAASSGSASLILGIWYERWRKAGFSKPGKLVLCCLRHNGGIRGMSVL